MNPIYYKEQGIGPSLMLLHGFCETHEIWEDIIPQLSVNYKVISLDLPGFGKSKILPSGFSIKDVGQSVIALLEDIGAEKYVLIGHSLGGYVALALAQERPDLVEGLCLFHSTALSDSDEKKQNRNRVIDFVEKNGVQPFIDTFVPGLFFKKLQKNISRVHEIASKTSKNVLLGYSAAMRDRPDMTSFLTGFPKSILFLTGKEDTFITVSSLAEQAKASKKGKLKVLTETGHMGMFEASIESIKILKDFGGACFHSIAP